MTEAEEVQLLEQIQATRHQFEFILPGITKGVNQIRLGLGLPPVSDNTIRGIMEKAGLPLWETTKRQPTKRQPLNSAEEAQILEQIQATRHQFEFILPGITKGVNQIRLGLGLPPVSEDTIRRIMKKAGLPPAKQGISIEEQLQILEQIQAIREQYPEFGVPRITKAINQIRSDLGLPPVSEDTIRKIKKKAGLPPAKQGISIEEKLQILEQIQAIREQYPAFKIDIDRITVEVNQARLDLGLKPIKRWRIQNIIRAEPILKQISEQIQAMRYRHLVKRTEIEINGQEEMVLFLKIREILEQHPEVNVDEVMNKINEFRLFEGKERLSGREIETLIEMSVLPEVQSELALMYKYGYGTKQDLKKASDWLTEIVERAQDVPRAVFELAVMHFEGKTVWRNAVLWGDRIKAEELFKRALEEGLPEREHHLAQQYLDHISENGYFMVFLIHRLRL